MAKAEYRSAIRSRKLINAALADLLQEKPLEKITVTDVVNRAEINRGTFYAHYRDIPDVVDHLIQETFSAIREPLTNQQLPPEEVVHALMAQLQRILEEDLYFCRKIMTSSAASIMQKLLVEIATEYFLQHKEEFFPGNEKQYELSIRFCAGGLSNLYRDWLAGKLPYTLDEITAFGEALICQHVDNLQ